MTPILFKLLIQPRIQMTGPSPALGLTYFSNAIDDRENPRPKGKMFL